MRKTVEQNRGDTSSAEEAPHRFPYSEIYPRENRRLGREPLPDYLVRIGAVLPNFPPAVIEDWLYRHSKDAVNHYGWLGFETFHFEKQTWDINNILRKVQAREPETITLWRRAFRTEKRLQESKLGIYMISHGTWPQPPIILNNSLGDIRHPRGETVHPRHLIEGHHRLGYLHALNDNEEWMAQPTHDVWIVVRP